jgi:hypothetical protein
MLLEILVGVILWAICMLGIYKIGKLEQIDLWEEEENEY